METFSQIALVTPRNQWVPLRQVSLFIRYQNFTTNLLHPFLRFINIGVHLSSRMLGGLSGAYPPNNDFTDVAPEGRPVCRIENTNTIKAPYEFQSFGRSQLLLATGHVHAVVHCQSPSGDGSYL